MKDDFPYQRIVKHPVWAVLDGAMRTLQANGDIEEKTSREYIVGYLAKVLIESGVIVEVPDP